MFASIFRQHCFWRPFSLSKSISNSDGTNLIFTSYFNQFIDFWINSIETVHDSGFSVFESVCSLFLMRFTRDMYFWFGSKTFCFFFFFEKNKTQVYKERKVIHWIKQQQNEASVRAECQTTDKCLHSMICTFHWLNLFPSCVSVSKNRNNTHK